MSDYYTSNCHIYMTKKEYDKNYMRVHDIMRKSKDDINKAISLAKTQANRISIDNKAISRYRVAMSEGFEEIADIFMRRAYKLGQVDKLEYRNWVINKLLEED